MTLSSKAAKVLAPENWARENSGPLYAQFSQHIENAIRAGQLAEGEALPSERDLALISNLSRVTIRKAVDELVRGGFIVKRHGSCSSVAPQSDRVQQSLSRLTSFSEDMERRGLTIESKWIERGFFQPSPVEIMTLGLSARQKVTRLTRLRIADGKPLAIEKASLSSDLLPDPEAIGTSLYAHLSQRELKPVRAIQRISADIAKAEEAKLLAIESGSAVLRIKRISYLNDGQIVEFTSSVYRGDAYDFVAELNIPEGT